MTEFARLLKLMRPWAGWILLGIFVSLVTLLANVTLMAISGWFIASMALAGLASVTMNYFTPAAVIRAMAITRTVGRYVERLITHEATLRLVAHMRRWFYDQLEPLVPAQLQEVRSGDLLSRIGADVSELENFYLRALVPACVALIAIPIFVVFTGIHSLPLALIMVGLYQATGIGLPLLIYRYGRTHSEQLVTQKAAMRSDLVEGLQGAREMLVYGRVDDFEAQIDDQSYLLSRSQKQLANLQALSQSGITLATNFSVLASLVLLIPLVNLGVWSGPTLPMVALFLMASFEVVLPLPLAIQTLISTRLAARRLFEIADRRHPIERSSGEGRTAVVAHSVPVPLQFDAVSFSYPGREETVFTDLSFYVAAGEKVAIIGPSGVGKSTIINLLIGFWSPRHGRIMLDGRPLSALSMDDVRAQFAVAPQRPHIFNSTVRGNLLLANPDATEQDLKEVVKIAELSDFIASLPAGLDSYVGEGGEKLSGGQIRRLSIARALLSKAPILILDEPGEGLARRMEADIIERIVKHRPDRSLILITHSPMGLHQMDKIIHLDPSAANSEHEQDQLSS